MRQGTAVYYLYGDHLPLRDAARGSTSLVTDAAGAAVSETRYQPYGQLYWQWGTSQTDFGFTGQRLDGFGLMDYNARYYDPLLGRFVSPDSIIPQPGSPLAWDRYSYTSNNPVNRVDPSGHADQVFGGGCDDGKEICQRKYVEGKASIILKRLGGRNDLEAMAQIVEITQSVYKTYDRMMPVLSRIFTGKEESSPITIWNAAMHNTGCGGLGRDPGDCANNSGLGNSFNDEGFHPDFQDGHNQLFHFWSYVATVAATDGPIAPLGQISGLVVGEVANVYHEVIDQDGQSTWQDYGLSVSGMQTGLYIGLEIIPPNQLGNYLRGSLGPSGYGSYGLTPLMISLLPLQGNR